MATTAVQQTLIEPVVDSPAPPDSAAPSGPLAAVTVALIEAAETIRALEPLIAQAAADSSVGMTDLAAVVEAANLAGRAAAGIETCAVAGYARRDEVHDEDAPFAEPRQVVRGRGFVHDDAGLEIAHVLRLSEGAGATRVERAAALVSRLPCTLAAVTAGEVELWQAHAVLDETALLDDEQARQVDAWLSPRLGSTDPSRLRAVTKYAIGRVDPDAIRRRATRSRADRTLDISPAHEPGLSHVYALIPSHHAAAIWEAASTLAKQYQDLDPDLTIDQARADAFVDLALADVDICAQVTLGMPIITSTTSAIGDAHQQPPPLPPMPPDPRDDWPEDPDETDRDTAWNPVTPDPGYDGPGVVPNRIPDWMLTEITDPSTTLNQSHPIHGDGPLAGTFTSGVNLPRIGYVPADVIAALFTHLDLTIARALIDATNGTVVETVTGAYRPTKKMREFVELRDGSCRMYGCTRPATAADLDHAVPHHRGGVTSPANLGALCRRHHRAKQAKHWIYSLSTDGVATWTCRRTGTVRQTHPATALAARENHERAHMPELEPERPERQTQPASPPDDEPPPF